MNFLPVPLGRFKQHQSWGRSSSPPGKVYRTWTPPCLLDPTRWAWPWRCWTKCTCTFLCLPPAPSLKVMDQVAKEVVNNKDLDFLSWSSTPCLLWTFTTLWSRVTTIHHEWFMNESLSFIKDSVQHLRSNPWRQKFPPYWIPENPSPLFSGYAQSRGTIFYSYGQSHFKSPGTWSSVEQPRYIAYRF